VAEDAGPSTGSSGCSYARAVNELLLGGLFAEVAGDEGPTPLALRVPWSGNGWLAWNHFRTLCDHHPRLSVALEIGGKRGIGTEREMARWLGEPVRFVILSGKAWTPNTHGYPVLPKRPKALLSGLFRHKVHVILDVSDVGCRSVAKATPQDGDQTAMEAEVAVPGGDAAGHAAGAVVAAAAAAGSEDTVAPRLNYVARLFQTLPPLTAAERFCHSHLDTLQAPLQPLQDNLETETYETFEQDPVKYAQYEAAVLEFLRDRKAAMGAVSTTIMVLGAGRGPLVKASLRAAATAAVEVAIWAVEKNPNAVHTLRHRRRSEEGWERVEIVAQDMRTWQAPRLADCVVSELLGSFGRFWKLLEASGRFFLVPQPKGLLGCATKKSFLVAPPRRS